jgi:nitroreductase
MDIIEKLQWRYATKKFDSAKKIDDAKLGRILESVRLSASSMGLQPYKILVIEDPLIRKQLRDVSFGQSQITDAAVLLIFAANTKITPEYITHYYDNLVLTRGVDRAVISAYEENAKKKFALMSAEEVARWSAHQAYLSLGFLLTTCAMEEVDTCPMEGFDAVAYDELLDLKEKHLHATVVAAIGYRAEDDHFQQMKKVRKPIRELVEVY